VPLRLTVAGHEPVLGGGGAGATGYLGDVLAAVGRTVAAGTWERLKICANDECRWAFYDRSKNRAGRWCTMAVCGNRTKTRVYRERHR
jgi:predicted RNA-binding Zn ribbon-like protein